MIVLTAIHIVGSAFVCQHIPLFASSAGAEVTRKFLAIGVFSRGNIFAHHALQVSVVPGIADIAFVGCLGKGTVIDLHTLVNEFLGEVKSALVVLELLGLGKVV